MSVTTHDIFGSADGALPAVAGTYGVAPKGYRLPDATRLGPVRLQVTDVARSLAYYEHVLGLRAVTRDTSHAALAPHNDARVLVELHERRDARPSGKGRLGLYHFAILLPDRPALGRFTRHLGDVGARAGAADHLVSEALYLTDPDGLGIEVYADRPRSTWQRLGRELMLATDPLDLTDLVHVAGETAWAGMPAGTHIGHLHLHVGDLEQGSAFYSEALGFDRITWRYPGAVFLGAGGYHHHLGTNTWAGRGAEAPPADEARLLAWTIELPSAIDLRAVHVSLTEAGFLTEQVGDEEILVHDPWRTQLRLRVAR